MKLKNGVILAGLDIRMRPALIAADKIWKKYGQELVITAGLDGAHSAGSLHYYGRALDMRINYYDKDGVLQQFNKVMAADELDHELGPDFDVVLHTTHIHVEYDPKS